MNSECLHLCVWPRACFLLPMLLINKDQDKEGEGHTTIMETWGSPQSYTSCIFLSTGAAEHPTWEEAQTTRELQCCHAENKAWWIILSVPRFNCHGPNSLQAGSHHKARLSTDSSHQLFIAGKDIKWKWKSINFLFLLRAWHWACKGL